MKIKGRGYFKRNGYPKVNANEKIGRLKLKITTGFLDSEVFNNLDERNLVEGRG